MIARALMMRPTLLVADEATSMLDASLRVNILNVLTDLRDELGMTVLFITHDIGQACYLADQVLVMEHGVMVEQGTDGPGDLPPEHEYTKKLLADVPEAARGDRAQHRRPRGGGPRPGLSPPPNAAAPFLARGTGPLRFWSRCRPPERCQPEQVAGSPVAE